MNREVGYPNQAKFFVLVRTEEDRDTEQLKLRLSPADAEAIRLAAKGARQTISAYVLSLHQRQPMPRPAAGWKVFDALADLQRAIEAIPNSVRKLDADLGRLSGRLKDLFNEQPAKAMAHQEAINATLRAVRDLRAEIMPVLGDLQAEAAEPRDTIDAVLAAVMPRRHRS
jgi:hypothetical protein